LSKQTGDKRGKTVLLLNQILIVRMSTAHVISLYFFNLLLKIYFFHSLAFMLEMSSFSLVSTLTPFGAIKAKRKKA
jgi:hypothetical protein